MNRQWIVGQEGAIYHYSLLQSRAGRDGSLVIYRPDQAAWTLSSATFAERATWDEGWQAA